MEKNYTPVTLEEYNQTLHDAVNAYYTHAQNDPPMTQDDVIQSTATMSEAYLNAVDEFQAEQDALNSGPEPDAEGEECDDGMDP